MLYSLFRFFIEAPLLATWIFLRSPRGIKKERWVAWRTVRAYRLGRKLDLTHRLRMNRALGKKLLREVSVPVGVDENQWIQWGRSFELVPLKDLEVRA